VLIALEAKMYDRPNWQALREQMHRQREIALDKLIPGLGISDDHLFRYCLKPATPRPAGASARPTATMSLMRGESVGSNGELAHRIVLKRKASVAYRTNVRAHYPLITV
jgi:hypothetical protein